MSTKIRCEHLVEVPNPLPGYAQNIYRPCAKKAVAMLGRRPVCKKHAKAGR